MADVQALFEAFHKKIRTYYEINDELREKKDIIVKRINNHVELTVRREDLENQELEVWVRDHVIAHIPGASHAPE